jgi:hypothetical protein
MMELASILHTLEARPLPALVPRSVHDPRLSAAIQACDCSPAVKAGLLLWNDDLDASHRLSQQIGVATGSYWHGIMHRREPDYANSKYWFNRVGRHPVMRALSDRADPEHARAAFLAHQRYDPLAFIDACEAAERQSDDSGLRRFQLLEIRALLDYCLTEAL